MPNLYVAGPVIDPHQEVPEVYRAVQDAAESRGWSSTLPVRDREVDGMGPRQFVRHVAGQISQSAAVVAVIPPDDQNAPVEATLAAAEQKPQLVVSHGAKRVPRLIEGLPGVMTVVDSHERDEVAGYVGKLIDSVDHTEPGPAAPAF
jgi:hypothetical protein